MTIYFKRLYLHSFEGEIFTVVVRANAFSLATTVKIST